MSYTSQAGYETFDAYKKPITYFGGGIGFEMGGVVGFELDFLYLRKGIRFQGSTAGVDFDINMNLDEITVPILLKAHLLNQAGLPDIYLMGGGEAGYIIQAQSVYTVKAPAYGIDTSDTVDIKPNINRFDYGVKWNIAVEAGGLVVSDKVDITLLMELQKQP